MKQILEPPRPSRPRDASLEPELEMLAQWMDNVFHIPGVGVRFGLDAIIGLIPGLGDTLTSLVSLYILSAGRRYGVPRATMLRMAGNIAVDYIVGSVPFVGDLFDVYWKANLKNVELLKRHVLATPVEQRRARRGDWLFVGGLIVVLIAILAGAITLTCLIIAWMWHVLVNPSR